MRKKKTKNRFVQMCNLREEYARILFEYKLKLPILRRKIDILNKGGKI